jgi:hypothetical protein
MRDHQKIVSSESARYGASGTELSQSTCTRPDTQRWWVNTQPDGSAEMPHRSTDLE